MGSTVPWDVELAFWTLQHILPDNHPKYNSACILNSSANYIEELSEKLQTLKYRVILSEQQNEQVQPDVHIADRHTFLISDEEEIELLASLGMDRSNVKFEGAQPEWVETIFTNQDYDNKENPYSNSTQIQQTGTKVKRPGNGFIRFSTEKRKEVLRLHPQSDNRQVSKILGVMWRKLTPEEKKPYIDQFVEHINVLRIAHPEWNYAASRAKSNVPLNKDAIVLDRRLRVRSVLPKYVLQEEIYPEKQMLKSKRKFKENSNGKAKKKLDKASDEEKVVWANCDLCNKWRKMPSDLNAESLPFSWICNMNTDPLHNSCDNEQEEE